MRLTIPGSLVLPRFVERPGILFVLFFLALSAIALSTWQGASYIFAEKERYALQQNAIDVGLYGLHQRASGILSGNATSLYIVSQSGPLQRLNKNTFQITDEFSQLLTSFIEASPNVYQIRYVDIEGRERIRIDKKAENLVSVPDNGLQQKEHRYYFSIVKDLLPGQLYVSPVDLNKDFGEIELPWKPTIRVAAGVFDDEKNLIGALVANVDVSNLLSVYATVDESVDVEVNVLNPEGYWIYGRSREELWGFMFGHKSTLGNDKPEVWQTIVSGGKTPFAFESDSWTYLPARVSSLFPFSLNYINADQILWYSVVRNPELKSAISSPAAYMPPVMIAIVLLAFSWVLAKIVNEKKRAEQELIKSEKLSSLGGLVAGVAHELNTPIGSAVTMASTIEDKANDLYKSMEAGEVRKKEISDFVIDVKYASNIMLRGLNRAVELIGHFKQIAVDQGGEQRRTFQFDNYIDEMAATFQHLFKHRLVILELDLNSKMTVDSYPGSLSQVVINLVQNALIHGFDAEDEGVIRIATRKKSATEVELSVFDNGKGIKPEVITRVFEPFFTTRMGYGGSGLGLHITYNIVSEILCGSIGVTSDPRQHATKFTLVIPTKPFNKTLMKTESSHD